MRRVKVQGCLASVQCAAGVLGNIWAAEKCHTVHYFNVVAAHRNVIS